MTRLLHLSDLHFGRQDEGPLEALSRAIISIAPDLVVISGDLTQRASEAEFRAARRFLDDLPSRHLVVPGNHDIPYWGNGERFLSPYRRYRKYITEDLAPAIDLDDAVVVGLNSTRSLLPLWSSANGSLSAAQLAEAGRRLGPIGARWRVCVLHHPLQDVGGVPPAVRALIAGNAIRYLADLRVDLVMTGHVHHAEIKTVGAAGHETVYLSGSTSLSSRLRKQENGFNLVELEADRLAIEHHRLREGRFVGTDRFERPRHRDPL